MKNTSISMLFNTSLFDWFEKEEDEVAKGIIHQANCQCIMGGGIAAKIKELYPAAYTADKVYGGSEPKDKLGRFSYAYISNLAGFVYNVYGQFDIGFGRHTNYEALTTGLERVLKHAIREGVGVLGLPYMMGCGLGGGDWRVVEAIIYSVFENKIDIRICNLNTRL